MKYFLALGISVCVYTLLTQSQPTTVPIVKYGDVPVSREQLCTTFSQEVNPADNRAAPLIK
jgi:hypothetical protein